MNHEIMTIEEVASYLRVSERTVYDWAQKGQLPGGKLGTAWRFKRSDIEGWVNRCIGSSAAPAPVAPGLETLSRILSPERVVFFDANEKTAALKTLCAALGTSPLIHNEAELEQAIFKREELMSTGIGFGVGVPHVRLASVDDLVMALGIARQPLEDYSSLDEIPVQIVCMVAASGTQHPQYIRALSAISSRLKDQSMRKALIEAKNAVSAFDIFTGGVPS
ncbi:MAG TPA: PTS sugar transporter subunit IIA [Pontiellaceae bacterium]|nr:PTS sugar transporter subunit IIA [Pontiellaceae bacterium]